MNSTPQYGFQEGLSSEFPSQLIVDITEVCNLGCVHCPHPVFKNSNLYGKRFLDPELNKKLVNEVRTEGGGHCQYIRYTSNGEPLVHPLGYKMIQDAVDDSKTFVCLTTNGTIMKERKTRQLLDSGIHMIDISLDAFRPETYAKIRIGGNLEITRENVLRLLKWVHQSQLDTKVVVSFVEQPNNKNEVADFQSFWKDHGATHVVIRRLHSASGAVGGIADTMREEQKITKRYPCLYPWERLTLDPKGYLAFCPTDWEYKSPFVNFQNYSIGEAWRGEFMQKLRQAHLKNDFSCHGFCGQCPDWASTRWPKQDGRRYADLVSELTDTSTIY
jgi:MoaA/NifB/PqqE/SkfB family radical SAM enzyme